MSHKPVVVIPNLNGGSDLIAATQSLLAQTLPPTIIVVDNASTDGSADKVASRWPDIEIIRHEKNLGYAGGVNPGFRRAIELGAKYTAPFNDDAVADPDWLKKLVDFLDNNPSYGAACPKVLKDDKKTIDSTGDQLTTWGLPYPRGRGEADKGQYDEQTEVFATSGAASLFRVKALKQVGIFDEDFFAYYEDVDLGFRLQLAGWRAAFVPASKVFHKIGMTSGRIKGFTTYQTLKNQPLLLWKNLPLRYFYKVMPRFWLAYILFFGRAITRGHVWPALKGVIMAKLLCLKKIPTRLKTQRSKKVSDPYIWSMLTPGLPPNAKALKKLRSFFKKSS